MNFTGKMRCDIMFKTIATATFDCGTFKLSKPKRTRPRRVPTENGIPQMLTIRELAEHTGLSESHIRKLCKTNKIKYIRAGVKYLINYDRFIDYLNGTI